MPWKPCWVSDWNNICYFDLQVTQNFLPNFKSIDHWVQEKKQKIDFQDGCHLGFLIWTVLAIFWPTSYFLLSYESIAGFRESHLGFPMILAIFEIYKSPWCFPLSFKSICSASCWWRKTKDRHWLIKIANLEHFVFRWAKQGTINFSIVVLFNTTYFNPV